MRWCFVWSLFLSGCVVPDIAIEGRPCPCPDEYTCDASTQTCVRGASSGIGGAGGAGGMGTTATAPPACMGRCGTPGCSPCPDMPVADAGGFTIDAFETRRADYAAFLADGYDPALQDPWCSWNVSFEPVDDPTGGCVVPFDYSQGDYPMTCVDWCDASAYCAWAGKRLCGRKGGGTVQLEDVNDPTKSEWFAACSANDTKAFPYGNSYEPNFCNTFGNGADIVGAGWFIDCEGGVAGVFDMSGNVEEWENACDLTGDPAGDNCLLRGGAFWSDATTPDRDYAMCNSNAERRPDRSAASHDWGFRCCGDP